MSWLINAAQLDKFRKNQKNLVILDCTWFLPNENRDPKQEFLDSHIQQARFFDLNVFHNPHSTLPHMLWLDEQHINAVLGKLGITNDLKIIFYDNSGLHTSCRVLWMFKVFGHNTNQLYILDGGLAAWKKYGGKIEQGDSSNVPKAYAMKLEEKYLFTLAQMKANQQDPYYQVVDLRHAIRFAGGPEPRPGKRVGHIPESFCFPYLTFFDNENWKPVEKIRKQLMGIGVDLNYPIVSMCGCGMAAPILNFFLDLVGYPEQPMYDGSWAEWGACEIYQGESSLADRPVVTSLES